MKALLKSTLRLLPPHAKSQLGLALLRLASEKPSLAAIPPLITGLEDVLLRLEDEQRRLKHPVKAVPNWSRPHEGEALTYQVMPTDPPWSARKATPIDMPGMLTEEEAEYYYYLPRFYTGTGEVVELGPWLGLSTNHLVRAFSQNPHFAGRKLHVYDDFVWRSDWMDRHLPGRTPPAHHSDFMALFDEYTGGIRDRLAVTKGKLADYSGNEALPPIRWSGQPIEMMVVDCGRTMIGNQAWYDLFSSAFIPNRTLVVMQDWRLHRERPRQAYNQTLQFTQLNPRLELVHEISRGGVATFLYR